MKEFMKDYEGFIPFDSRIKLIFLWEKAKGKDKSVIDEAVKMVMAGNGRFDPDNLAKLLYLINRNGCVHYVKRKY
jgi:hypothetical protein